VEDSKEETKKKHQKLLKDKEDKDKFQLRDLRNMVKIQTQWLIGKEKGEKTRKLLQRK
jgi:hypothetical protein